MLIWELSASVLLLLSMLLSASSLPVLVLLGRQSIDGEQFLGRVAQKVLEVADETVDIPLSRRLVDDVLIVVVAQTAAQLLVVHLRFVLANAPSLGHLIRVGQFELPTVSRPGDEMLTRLVRQLFQEKLPQLDRTAS